ncbi:uncharacterized protein LOC111074863 [Drosophila obscura]|uniref:uncharacterized protein LOC111074863 n=1 Tax=Drosophila obscura TaxID=7282 RepID=UPI001BB1770F|nr:uncharacterized protein LOC111074863 [Drosophila obscura]XP_022223518.2 uncharacterized protein LOC111074863 [Drosophila obscura]XP_022223519.2 uncharacterized protein LOC111074863 [Drosophila obscura]
MHPDEPPQSDSSALDNALNVLAQVNGNAYQMNLLPDRHIGFPCRQCQMVDYAGLRYTCFHCKNYHLCGICYSDNHMPASPNHKYYHIMQVFYTRTAFQLYYDGEEPSTSPMDMQSFKCALCQRLGFTIETLYQHLLEMHRDHADYKDYLLMAYSYYFVDYTSRHPGAVPLIAAQVVGGSGSRLQLPAPAPAPAPLAPQQAPMAAAWNPPIAGQSAVVAAAVPVPFHPIAGQATAGSPFQLQLPASLPPAAAAAPVPIIQLEIPGLAPTAPAAAPRTVYRSTARAPITEATIVAMDRVLFGLQRVMDRLLNLDLNIDSYEAHCTGLVMRARSLREQFSHLQANNIAHNGIASNVDRICRLIEMEGISRLRARWESPPVPTSRPQVPFSSVSSRPINRRVREVTSTRLQEPPLPPAAASRRAAAMPPLHAPTEGSNGNVNARQHHLNTFFLCDQSAIRSPSVGRGLPNLTRAHNVNPLNLDSVANRHGSYLTSWQAVPQNRQAVPQNRQAVPQYRQAVPQNRQAVVPNTILVGPLGATPVGLFGPPPKKSDNITELVTGAEPKLKSIDKPNDKWDLTDDRFCCSKLKKAFEKMPGNTEHDRKVSKARFVNAVICSMLTEEELSSVPLDLHSMQEMRANQTPPNATTAGAISELKPLAEQLNQGPRCMPVTQNVGQARESGVNAMTKYLKGLVDYHHWLDRLTQNIEAKKGSKESEDKKKGCKDPEAQATSSNRHLENILQINSSADYGQDGHILGAGINGSNDLNPIAFIDSNDGDADDDESYDEESKAGTDFANDDNDNGNGDGADNNNNTDANNNEDNNSPPLHIDIFNTLNNGIGAPEGEENQQPLAAAAAAVAVPASDVAAAVPAIIDDAEIIYVPGSDSEASDDDSNELDYLFEDDDSYFGEEY